MFSIIVVKLLYPKAIKRVPEGHVCTIRLKMAECHTYAHIVLECHAVRELRRLVDNLQAIKKQKLKVKDLKGSYLDQTKKFLDVFYNLDISQCPTYTTMDDLRHVRNCIVHNHGELSLCENRERRFLESLEKKDKHFLLTLLRS